MAEVKVCNFLMAQDGSQRQTLSAALPFAARDATGHIKPHSFLGSLDDMTAAANVGRVALSPSPSRLSLSMYLLSFSRYLCVLSVVWSVFFCGCVCIS